jgi:type IV pilus assembly protein PilC
MNPLMARISQSQMAKLFQRLATSYSAGIDIRSAVKRETSNGSPSYQIHTKMIYDQISNGEPLADAMASADGYFPDLAISVVKAGEKGGRLEESFARLGDHYKSLVTFRNNFLSAIAWPAFELVFAIVICGGLIFLCDFIMDSIGFEKIDWFWMGSTTGNIIAYFVLIGLFFTGLTTLVVGTIRGWFGNFPMKVALKIPLIGSTLQSLALSRFAWTMSIAENAGMDAIEIAKLSLRSTENFFYKQLEPEVIDSIRAGNAFYPTLLETECFPDDFLVYVDNGEQAGELAESMDRASHELQDRAERNLQAIGKIGFVAMMMFVAAVVAFIAIFAVSQYVKLLNGVANGDFI